MLAARGRHAEVRALLIANHRSLEDSAAKRDDEKLLAEVALNGLDFLHLGAGPPPPGRVDVAGRIDPEPRLGSLEVDRLPAEEWARNVARALRFDDGTRPPTFRESEATFWFTRQLIVAAGDHRKVHRLDLAGRTADRMLALARLVVERNPSDPVAHLVLADAYDQFSKNARPVNDRPTVEDNLRRAVDENQRALEIAPDNEIGPT